MIGKPLAVFVVADVFNVLSGECDQIWSRFVDFQNRSVLHENAFVAE